MDDCASSGELLLNDSLREEMWLDPRATVTDETSVGEETTTDVDSDVPTLKAKLDEAEITVDLCRDIKAVSASPVLLEKEAVATEKEMTQFVRTNRTEGNGEFLFGRDEQIALWLNDAILMLSTGGGEDGENANGDESNKDAVVSEWGIRTS